uniref:Non-specific serine/threonine protein kinase n=1 Tax=Rhizophora mucronata TaxID=61149 RepID=A0A2P2LRQ8_RHIMU
MQPNYVRMSDNFHDGYLSLDLINHFVLENGGFGQNFHGHTLTSLCVPCKLDLRKGPFPDGPAELVLPYSSSYLLHDSSKHISRIHTNLKI